MSDFEYHCTHCGSKNLEDGSLTPSKGTFSITIGDQAIKDPLRWVGNRHRVLRMKLCKDCGYVMTFLREYMKSDK